MICCANISIIKNDPIEIWFQGTNTVGDSNTVTRKGNDPITSILHTHINLAEKLMA